MLQPLPGQLWCCLLPCAPADNRERGPQGRALPAQAASASFHFRWLKETEGLALLGGRAWWGPRARASEDCYTGASSALVFWESTATWSVDSWPSSGPGSGLCSSEGSSRWVQAWRVDLPIAGVSVTLKFLELLNLKTMQEVTAFHS